MSRINKKSRIRQLPGKLQLQERDALTGSYPTTVRLASDNRNGNYIVNFDDTNTIDFTLPITASPEHLNLNYDPIALYNFNGDINDTSGNDFHLSLATGSIQFTDGPFSGSQALYLNGETIISSSIEETLQIDGAVTIQAFFNPERLEIAENAFRIFIASLAGNEGGFFEGDSEESLRTNILYSLAINPEGASGDTGTTGFVLERAAGVNYVGEQNNTFIVTGSWNHLAVARNNSNQSTVYLNGTNVGTFNHSSPTFPEKDETDNVQKLFLGFLPYITEIPDDQNVPFVGAISNLKIVDRELTSDEISNEYKRIFPTITSTNLLGGIGFPVESKWIKNRQEIDLPITGVIVPGVVRSQVIEGQSFLHFTPGQDLEPFKENNKPVLDGLSSRETYYLEGSPVNEIGEGFSQPLWSKSKIQIKLPVSGLDNTIQTYISGGLNLETNTDPASGSVIKTEGGPLTDNGFGNVDLSYPMAYYNFDTKRWEGIGRGEAYCYLGTFMSSNGITSASVDWYNTRTVGFSQGFVSKREGSYPYLSASFEYAAGAGHPITNYGFPFDARYHATSSQILRMSDYINEPFMVEKIVVDFSGSFEFNPENFTTSSILINGTNNPNTILTASIPAAINNFFILNQRKNYSFNKDVRTYYSNTGPSTDQYIYSNLLTNVTLSNAAGPITVNTVRDVVTYGGVSSFAANMPTSVFRGSQPEPGGDHAPMFSNHNPITLNPKELMTRDFVFESTENVSNNLTPLNWNSELRMELFSNNLTKVSEFFGMIEFGNELQTSIFDENFDFGGRNGLGITNPTGRDTNSPINTITIDGFATHARTGRRIILTRPDAHKKYGGYMLYPEDNLVFGWQQPVPMILVTDNENKNVNDGMFSTMTFGNATITIYGSNIREGKEYHDTLNQLLSSNAINEVIG